MKTLYLECSMGASGDMLMGALYELLDSKDKFLATLNSLGAAQIIAEESVKCGIAGTHMRVIASGVEELSIDEDLTSQTLPASNHHTHEYHDHPHHEHVHSVAEQPQGRAHGDEHGNSTLMSVTALVKTFSLPEKVKSNIIKVYSLLAEAESSVHGKPMEQIHFHEVGSLDAIADIAGVCLAIDMLGPDEIISSPVHLGSGHVRCAHGILPVPAPATAYILKGVPTYSRDVKGELCTPTGAALLKCFAAKFSPMPLMSSEKIGYGMGFKDFKAANCVRAFLGTPFSADPAPGGPNGQVVELSCNLDDMTGEAIAFSAEILLENGALDAFLTPILMKKGRPATMLTCLCQVEKADFFAALMLKHTTTFGVRRHVCERYTLNRHVQESSADELVMVKYGYGYGVEKHKLEYEDIAKLARETGRSLDEEREIQSLSIKSGASS